MNDAWTLKVVLGGDVRRRFKPRMGFCGSSLSFAHVLSGVSRLHGGTSTSIEGWYVIDEEGDRCTLNSTTFSNALELSWEDKRMFITMFLARSDARHTFVRGSRQTAFFLLVPQSCVRLLTSRSRRGVDVHTVFRAPSDLTPLPGYSSACRSGWPLPERHLRRGGHLTRWMRDASSS